MTEIFIAFVLGGPTSMELPVGKWQCVRREYRVTGVYMRFQKVG